MSVVVRYMTRLEGGREAVRTVELDRSVLSVGRAEDNDIVLPDLDVALRHARIEVVQAGAVLVRAEGAHRLRLAGRPVREARLRLATPRRVVIAPYALVFRREDGRLVVDVERASPEATTAAVARTEREAFTLKRWWFSKRSASWTLIALVTAACLAFPIWAYSGRAAPPSPIPASGTPSQRLAGRISSPGKLSSAHAFMGHDCRSCHVAPAAAVSDAACLTCHKGLQDHADPARMARATVPPAGGERLLQQVSANFGKPPGRCTACHMEHFGTEALTPHSQALCADCHKALARRLPDARVANAADFFSAHPQFRPTLVAEPRKLDPVLTRRWTIDELRRGQALRESLTPRFDARRCDGFAIGRPNFRGLPHLSEQAGVPEAAKAGDNSGLVFPHALHLSASGCVAALAQRLHVPLGRDGALGCGQCHAPDATGMRFQPVRMERNCSVCHSLTFDTFNGVDRRLPHGQPQAVIGMMLDFYKAQAVSLVRQSDAGERHRPGEAAVDRLAGLRTAAFTTADARAAGRVRAIFSPGGSCYGCHEIVRPSVPAALNYDVAPVSVRSVLLPLAEFDHAVHTTAGVQCAGCHAAKSSRSSTDVLLPGVETCRTCHAGEHAFASVASPCVTCHRFHGADGSAGLISAHARRAAEAALRSGLQLRGR